MAIKKVKFPDSSTQDVHDARITGIDTTPTNGSTNVISSGGVYTALGGKQDTISDLATIREGASAGASAYQKPAGGIPQTDMTTAVQTSLSKANTALQSHQDISGKEDKANKVISLSPSSNNSQYPSALCVYSLIAALTDPFSYEIVSSKPTASASTMGIIYLVTNGSNTEFWATKEISGSYSWQQLGTLATSITTITNGEIDALFE